MREQVSESDHADEAEINPTAALADGTGDQYVAPNETVDIALSRMIEADITSVPVVKDDDVIGMVTESDIRAYQSQSDGGV